MAALRDVRPLLLVLRQSLLEVGVELLGPLVLRQERDHLAQRL